jgi:hypothetical protein
LSEGRVSSPFFNLRVYLANNPDLVAAGLNQKQAYEHFVLSGQSEGRPGSDYAGDTLNTARDIIISSNPNTYIDFVNSNDVFASKTNPTDPNDYYRFNLGSTTNLSLSIIDLTGNANLHLIQDTNNNGVVDPGEVLQTSANSGTTSELILYDNLAAGTYYIQVYADNMSSAFTYYNLGCGCRVH